MTLLPFNKIISVKLVFENVESITLDSEVLINADFGEITQKLYTLSGSIKYPLHASEVEMSFKDTLFDLDNLIVSNIYQYGDDSDEMLLKLLKEHLYDYRDITSVVLKTADHREFWVIVPWSEESNTMNEWMEFEKTGDRYLLTINKDS